MSDEIVATPLTTTTPKNKRTGRRKGARLEILALEEGGSGGRNRRKDESPWTLPATGASSANRSSKNNATIRTIAKPTSVDPVCAPGGCTAKPDARKRKRATAHVHTDTPHPKENQPITTEFEQWLEKHGCKLPQSLEIQALDKYGCGIVTRVPIADQIMKIPLTVVLSEDKVVQSMEGQAFDTALKHEKVNDNVNLTPRCKLYCFLISQRNSPTSFFGPYLRSLPRRYNTPYYWSPGDLELLNGTTLANSVRDTTAALTSEFNLCWPLLSHQFPNLFPASIITFQDYLWAHSTYTSRGFPARVGDTHSSGTLTLGCLLPLVDLLNHRHGTPIEWNTNDTELIVKHCGTTNIGANRQVFNNYGTKSNGEFLLGYGFCVEDNLEYDTVSVVVGISSRDPLHRQKLDAMEHFGVTLQCYLNARHLSIELLQVLRIAVMDEPELTEANKIPKESGSLDYINAENELNMMESLERLIQQSLAKISNVPAVTHTSASSTNARNAMLFRTGQRHVLETYMNTFLPEYRARVTQEHAEEFAPYLD